MKYVIVLILCLLGSYLFQIGCSVENYTSSILLRDLTARLSYGVKGIITYDKSNTIFTVEGIDNNVLHLSDAEDCYVEDFKPYLRPMSSMTEEEIFEQKSRMRHEGYFVNPLYFHTIEEFDYLNSIHVDYRGLIERGLALEASEGMYDIKE